MAAASIRPHIEFRDEDRATAQWHYIDICLQDKESDLPARCPHGNCVTPKIKEYARRLRNGDYDKWGAAGDLAFLIHFVGDIHQPCIRQRMRTGAERANRSTSRRQRKISITRGTMLLLRYWRDSSELAPPRLLLAN
jgi:S1/P1 Nuclease